jgi:hypothetical protein
MYGDEEIVNLLLEILRRLERVERMLKDQQKTPFTLPALPARRRRRSVG